MTRKLSKCYRGNSHLMWDALRQRLQKINRRLEQLTDARLDAALPEEFATLSQERRRIEQSCSPASEQHPHDPPLAVTLKTQSGTKTPSGGIFTKVNCELAKLEKRDWELWCIVSVTGIVVGAGLLAVLLPAAFLKNENFHLEVNVSRQLVLGLMVLLILLNAYLVSRRVELRRLRQRVISSTIQNELIRLQSFTDPLTEIYNRRSLEDLANRYISHARRLKKPLTFLLIDVDRFKQVNTRFGHLTGDVVLAEIAGLLRTAIRGSDAVIRYGGDEFLIILADASASQVPKVVERVQAYLSDWNKAAHLEDFIVSLSIGIAEWSDGKTLDETLDLADQDMYAKKKKVHLASPSTENHRSAAASSSGGVPKSRM